jgi:CRISPR-associated endonuclease Cas1
MQSITYGNTMASATQTSVDASGVRHTENIAPERGVVTLFGYGISANVERGHLILHDGIGADRRFARFPRIGHGLRRLVVVGADGMISLAALRWLADQEAAFVMLDRDGSVLATTGPVRSSDARLRRAQALAHHSGAALRIVRELISKKLVGQAQLARNKLRDLRTGELITQMVAAVGAAQTIQSVRQLESQAAKAYWFAWRELPVNFPQRDLNRVPDHWRIFGTRKSPLTESPRLAVNPPNAMLNYLYALLESESCLALTALGLDPGMGVLHVDSPSRSSFACDVMESVRPQVDAYVFDWINRELLRREWFFEKRDGNCRLMAPLAVQLAETAPTWGHAVAPIAEWISRTLWSTLRKPASQIYLATRLTQRRRRQAKGGPSVEPTDPGPQATRICRSCGELLKRGRNYCVSCSVSVSRANLVEAAKKGRVATHRPKAEALRAETQRRHAAARKAWRLSDNADWLTDNLYREQIQPRLSQITVPTLSTVLGISKPYATDIRAGKRTPHPRHWPNLAQLIGISNGS